MSLKPANIVLIVIYLAGLGVLWLNKTFWLDLIGQRSLIPVLDSSNKAADETTKMSLSEGRAISRILNDIRIGVAMHYMETNQLPRDLNIYLNLPKESSGSEPKVRALDSGAIEILAGGRPEARIYYSPQPIHSLAKVNWICISPDITNINYHIPECQYNRNYQTVERIQVDYVTDHRVLFKFDKTGIAGLSDYGRKDFEEFLKNMSPSAVQEIIQVDIIGYTDPIGSAKRNIRLADSRVAFVREAFAKLGIDRQHIITRVIGIDPKPVRKCPPSMLREERIDCFSQSRRVEIKIKYKKDV